MQHPSLPPRHREACSWSCWICLVSVFWPTPVGYPWEPSNDWDHSTAQRSNPSGWTASCVSLLPLLGLLTHSPHWQCWWIHHPTTSWSPQMSLSSYSTAGSARRESTVSWLGHPPEHTGQRNMHSLCQALPHESSSVHRTGCGCIQQTSSLQTLWMSHLYRAWDYLDERVSSSSMS